MPALDGPIIWVVRNEITGSLSVAFEDLDGAIGYLKTIPLQVGWYLTSDGMEINDKYTCRCHYEIEEVMLVKKS